MLGQSASLFSGLHFTISTVKCDFDPKYEEWLQRCLLSTDLILILDLMGDVGPQIWDTVIFFRHWNFQALLFSGILTGTLDFF